MTALKNLLTTVPTVEKRPKHRVSRGTMFDGYKVTVFTSRLVIFSEFKSPQNDAEASSLYRTKFAYKFEMNRIFAAKS
jgi:hypothetical protein